jgi:hypothetical protein
MNDKQLLRIKLILLVGFVLACIGIVWFSSRHTFGKDDRTTDFAMKLAGVVGNSTVAPVPASLFQKHCEDFVAQMHLGAKNLTHTINRRLLLAAVLFMSVLSGIQYRNWLTDPNVGREVKKQASWLVIPFFVAVIMVVLLLTTEGQALASFEIPPYWGGLVFPYGENIAVIILACAIWQADLRVFPSETSLQKHEFASKFDRAVVASLLATSVILGFSKYILSSSALGVFWLGLNAGSLVFHMVLAALLFELGDRDCRPSVSSA